MIHSFCLSPGFEDWKKWCKPTFSPEHGVILVLFGSLLTGASLAQAWTLNTSLACLCALLGLQAQHPLVVQIKQRRSWKPRFLIWAGLYGGSALGIAGWLCCQTPLLVWVVLGAMIALFKDVHSVLSRTQKSIPNEIVMFAAICLSTLLSYGATTGTLTIRALGLWILNTLFYSGAVFTIKLRKTKTSALQPSLIYYGLATLTVAALYGIGWLSVWTALTFVVALLKLGSVLWQRDWYRTCRFEFIARFETYFALVYIALASLTVLPPRLPVA